MNPHTNWIRQLMVRELETLLTELELFPSDELIWAAAPGITNSAGNLALHLCGNLQHFVGKVLGHTEYTRNRDLEFSQRNLPRVTIVAEIAKTIAAVNLTLLNRSDDALELEYPDVLGGLRLPSGLFLQQLCSHLAFHLGQVGYLRRLLTGDGRSSGAVSMHALAPGS